MTLVLVAEDEEGISAPLARALRKQGHAVEISGDGQQALDIALRPDVDLVVLDIGLPGIDGLEVCRRVRAAGVGTPVLMLTGRTDEGDTVQGLDAGADDYLTKPFGQEELLARVRALLRRAGDLAAARVATAVAAGGGTDPLQGVRIDADSHQAWVEGRELALTAKEFNLLRVLVREAGKVVTREQLMLEVWETTWWQSSKTLDMHISWLRRKLGDDAAKPRYIRTVRGVGFRFERD